MKLVLISREISHLVVVYDFLYAAQFDFLFFLEGVYTYIYKEILTSKAFPGGSVVKNLPAVQETQVQSLGLEDPLEKGMATHHIFLPGESHGQRSLAGCSPQGYTELDMTEV